MTRRSQKIIAAAIMLLLLLVWALIIKVIFDWLVQELGALDAWLIMSLFALFITVFFYKIRGTTS